VTTVASIATVPERAATLKAAVASLESQVDSVQVYQNIDWGELPGDYGKFFGLGSSGREWFFTCDDDILYPPDYVERMIRFSAANDDAVVTCHGRTFLGNGFPDSYYEAQVYKYHCLGDVLNTQPVDVPGSGVALIPRKWMKSVWKALPRPTIPNAADLYLALALKVVGIQALVMPHAAGWIRVVKGDYRTIYDEVAGRDERPQIALMTEYLS